MTTSNNYLSLDVIQLILTQITSKTDLYQCIFINKLFYKATIPRLWHSLGVPAKQRSRIISTTRGDTTTRVLKCLQLARNDSCLNPIPLGHHIRHLTISSSFKVKSVVSLLQLAPMVEHLHLSTTMTDTDMKRIVVYLTRLQTLVLAADRITDKTMDALAAHCPRLTHLDLSSCLRLTCNTFLALAKCPLESLKINDCERLLKGASHARHLDTLTRLDIWQCSAGPFIHSLFDPTQPPVLPLLTHISVDSLAPEEDDSEDDAYLGDDSWLAPFFKTHPHLESIHLAACVYDQDALDALHRLPRLKKISFDESSGISSQDVRQVIYNAPLLDSLDLEECRFPRRCFPECNDEEFRQVYDLGKDEIDRIRNGARPVFTADDDILHESEIDDDC
ncbi:hypothetical protein [Absidia glauca]|uniref:F-box domain-containing protein n=1 Tax=Absidia glauca TaxID=4829 RepID=A0A168Q634_ABSGL|nr:hypothetical protein [Absidia glauca]